MAFTHIRAGIDFKLSQILIVIVLCSILQPSQQDFYSDILEQELKEELYSANVNRENRQTKSVYDASGVKQTPICGLNSLSSVNRKKRDTNEPQGIHDWPWMAVLLKGHGYQQFCGGTLLNRQYVLTAAHCFFEPGEEKDPENVIVRLGDWNLDEEDETKYQEFEIKKIEKHIKYDPGTEQNDILLIKLDRSVEYTQYIRPLCLPSIDVNADQTLFVSGWGVKNTSDFTDFSNILLDVEVPFINHETCASRLGANVDEKINLCAGTPRKDSCQGDSGGPLVVQQPDDQKRWMIVGIVSWGRGCAGDSPGVYTNVRNYLDWIRKHILDAEI